MTQMKQKLALFAPIGLLVLIAGCSTAPHHPTAQPLTRAETPAPINIAEELRQKAQMAAAKGNLIIAAQSYLQAAQQSNSPQKEDNLLAAADILVRNGHNDRARDVLKRINPLALTHNQTLRFKMTQARLRAQQGEVDYALEHMLFNIDERTPVELQIEWLTLKAELYSQAGKAIATARTRITLESLLSDEVAIQRNHQFIWLALSQLTAPALVTQRDQPPPDIFSGWIELAYFAKISENNTHQFETQLTQWRQRYPNHPAQGSFLQGLTAIQKMLFHRPDNVALLLPLSGNFSAPANAIRDGFMAAFYNRENDGYTPNIRVYDTTGDLETGLATYQRAVSEGAEFIIGPLRKPLLEALAEKERLPVTTLALNYLPSEDQYVENLYQYGLLPEDEARQVAERAWLDGHNNALVLIPDTEWGERMLSTFEKHWEQLDGRVLEIQRYTPTKHDFAGPVIDLLNIDQSKQRHRNLENLLGQKLETEARRRQDVDFIFVAAYPQQARQIRPQLKFYYASEVPIYSTSHAFGGEINTTQDRDMNGITFCDMPWVFKGGEGQSPRWDEFTQIWSANATPFKRLYAMGIDAYQLISLLPQIENRQTQVEGQTGKLYMDNANRVHRQLMWAYFHNGKPRLIDPKPPQIDNNPS